MNKTLFYGFLALINKEHRQTINATTSVLFLAMFLAVLLFDFFWVSGWFSRNLADMRPMFESLPLLLIFLASAITMKTWSEEKHRGTFEYLITLPMPIASLVLGKFIAQVQILILALLLSLPLPLSLHFAVTPLDFGPIIGGYLATLFMGAAYLAIGQYASARTDNPITALLWAVLLSTAFYLIGSPNITDFVDSETAAILRSLGTGARFESIAKGVLDIRDVAYYFTLTSMFLLLTIERVNREGISPNIKTKQNQHEKRRTNRYQFFTLIVISLNLIAIHLWLAPLGNMLRIDLTSDKRFSLAPITIRTLENISTPVLIRGYFSKKTHPLLAPLQSELLDRLQELVRYQPKRLRVEVVDPKTAAEIEEEASVRYKIHPLPFRINDRYEASVISAYFHVLVQVGDRHQVLSVRDLLDFKTSPSGQTEVLLRNPEYEMLRAIRSVQAAFGEGERVSKTIAFFPPINVSKNAAAPELAAASSTGILQFNLLQQALLENYQVEQISHTGALNVDKHAAAIIVAPRQLPDSVADDLAAFQKKGGHLIIMTSAFQPVLTNTSLGIQTIVSGVESWLSANGINLGKSMVLDSENSNFPSMTSRNLSNGYSVPEMLLAPYPYFVTIRKSSKAKNNASKLQSPFAQSLLQGIPSLVLPWTSFINVEKKLLPDNMKITTLINSSEKSWLSNSIDVVPVLTRQGKSGFTPRGLRQTKTLALMLSAKNANVKTGSLAVIASNAFASDGIQNLQNMATGQPTRSAQQWLQNLLDSMLGDVDLVAIRARSALGKTLPPLSYRQKLTIEWGNYIFAMLGIGLVVLLSRFFHRLRHRRFLKTLKNL